MTSVRPASSAPLFSTRQQYVDDAKAKLAVAADGLAGRATPALDPESLAALKDGKVTADDRATAQRLMDDYRKTTAGCMLHEALNLQSYAESNAPLKDIDRAFRTGNVPGAGPCTRADI